MIIAAKKNKPMPEKPQPGTGATVNYTVIVDKAAAKDLAALPADIKVTLGKDTRDIPNALNQVNSPKLDRIQSLKGQKGIAKKEFFRYKSGDYRILFAVDRDAKEVTILGYFDRKDAYDSNTLESRSKRASVRIYSVIHTSLDAYETVVRRVADRYFQDSLDEYYQNQDASWEDLLEPTMVILGENFNAFDSLDTDPKSAIDDIMHALIFKDRSLYRQWDKIYRGLELPTEDSYSVDHLLDGARTNLAAVQRLVEQAISRIDWWPGLTLTLSINAPKESDIDWDDAPSAFTVTFKDGSMFSIFLEEDGKVTVDDVMEGGDDFEDPAIQAPYFALVQELRKPGSSTTSKRIKLYTARPQRDRGRFENTTTLPVNMFLSSSEDDAEGIARDFGARDLYLIVTDTAYLVQTLDTPTVKHYQVVREAPVYRIERIA